MCRSIDLCGQLLEAVLLDADKISAQFFVSEEFDRSITYYDMLDKSSHSSPDIVRSLHLSVKPLIFFDSSLGSNIPK